MIIKKKNKFKKSLSSSEPPNKSQIILPSIIKDYNENEMYIFVNFSNDKMFLRPGDQRVVVVVDPAVPGDQGGPRQRPAHVHQGTIRQSHPGFYSLF